MCIYYSAFNPERKSLKGELVLWLVLINGDMIMWDEGDTSPLSRSFTCVVALSALDKAHCVTHRLMPNTFLHSLFPVNTKVCPGTVGGRRKPNDTSLFQGCLNSSEAFHAICTEVYQTT